MKLELVIRKGGALVGAFSMIVIRVIFGNLRFKLYWSVVACV